ncbi:MAG: HEAT repeat domain-containing protein [Polyangiales bacterium]
MKLERNELSSPNTVLGQLQRGQGRGYLAARESNDVDALLHCIHRDPRWDRQLERRDIYYARLAMELEVDIRAIAARFDVSFGDHDDELNLTAGVLVELGKRGVTGAFDALRAALRSPNWRAAARALSFAQMDSDKPLVNKADLSALMVHDDLRQLVWRDSTWQMWAELEPRLKPLLRQDMGPAHSKARREAAPKPDTSMSTVTLLSIVCRENQVRVSNVLKQRRDAASVAALVSAGQSGTESQKRTALMVLAEQHNPSLIQSCTESVQGDPPPLVRTEILRYLAALPAEHTLPVARRFQGRLNLAGVAAAGIFARHAEAEDREALEGELHTLLDKDHLYRVSSVAEALGAIGNVESADTLRQTFLAVPYAYVRQHLIRALHICAPAEAIELAPDALFDSDEGTRLWATEHVRGRRARERLDEMAADEFEWGYVRKAATKRLAARDSRDL